MVWEDPDDEPRFDYELLDGEEPFEIDSQIAHLFKHANLGLEDATRSGPTTRASTPLDTLRRTGY